MSAEDATAAAIITVHMTLGRWWCSKSRAGERMKKIMSQPRYQLHPMHTWSLSKGTKLWRYTRDVNQLALSHRRKTEC